MSRRAAVVEEFDDDTDLPLPSMPLPNTGARGPILQELNDDSDEIMILTRLIRRVLRLRQGNNLSLVPNTNGPRQM
jgi:hypothetical protein